MTIRKLSDGSFVVPEKNGEITVRYTDALHAVPALCYRFEKNGQALLDFQTDRASFEFEY